jgi:hypothetical protein
MGTGARARQRGLFCFIGATLIGGSWAAAQTPPPNGYSIQTLMFPGSDYTTTVSGQTTQRSSVFRINAFGAIGTVDRINDNGVDGFVADGSSIQRVGMTGPAYEYSGPSGIRRASAPLTMVSPTHILGSANRYGSDGTGLGTDIWLFNGSTYTVISPTGAAYEHATPGGTFRQVEGYEVSESGHAYGYIARVGSAGEDLGRDAWSYSSASGTHLTGLPGGDYQYAAPGGTHRFDETREGNALGHLIGTTYRFSANGGDLGADAWHFNGTSTTRIGFSGAGYEYATPGGTYRSGYVEALSATGVVTGDTTRYAADGTPLGADAWYYNGANHPIGLTGGIYEHAANPAGLHRESHANGFATNGNILGHSRRFGADGSDLGYDGWDFNGTTTQIVGLTGAGYEYTTPAGIARGNFPTSGNAAGRVIGLSGRYDSVGQSAGQDVWLYDGVTTKRINPVGGDYEHTATAGGVPHRVSIPAILTESDRVWGEADRFNSTSTQIGKDAWTYGDDNQTRIISLTGGFNEYAYAGGGNVRMGGIENWTESGFATGYNIRFSSGGADLGRSSWFYDDDDDLTIPLVFSERNDGYAYTQSHVLTEEGVVLGEYARFEEGTGAAMGLRAFWWSREAGLHDLGTLSGDLAAAGWDSLRIPQLAHGTFVTGAPRFIAGIGLTTNQNPNSGTAFLLAANVPEPSAAALVTLAMTPQMRRRRRAHVAARA